MTVRNDNNVEMFNLVLEIFYKMGEETLELAKNVDGCLAPEISTSVKPVYITIRQ